METVNEAAPVSEERGRQRPRGWRGGLAVVVAGVALLTVVATFGAILLAHSGAPSARSATSGGPLARAIAVPKDWKVYHDPLGLFTISLPPHWTATVIMGTFNEGNISGSMSGRDEDIIFRDPAKRDGVNIFVNAMQTTSDFGRQWYCDGESRETARFNGYHAETIDPPGTVWLFESSNAHFQVDVEIPGVLVPANPGGPMNPPPTPTAPPQSVIQADRALLATALASFKPATKPLTCS